MITLTPEQMREIDKNAINQFGISGIVLMENAGISVYQAILKEFNIFNKQIIIICGQGNNGGDGFVIARHFYNNNLNVKVFFNGNKKKLSNESLTNLKIIEHLGVEIKTSFESLKKEINKSNIIIDCIFGTGLTRNIEGKYYKYIELINNSKKNIVSVDIPSGICGKTGKVMNIAVKSDLTITLGAMKTGMCLYPGKEYCGKIICSKISIPEKLLKYSGYEIINREKAKNIFPKRENFTHKGKCGKCLVLAGSREMKGAAVLCVKSCLRSGTGLVYSFGDKELSNIINSNISEAITIINDEKATDIKTWNKLKKYIEKCDVIIIGPGWTVNKINEFILEKILKMKINKKIILDADALNIISKNIKMIKNTVHNIILTPHIGEMSRLTKLTIEEIENNVLDIAKEFSIKYNVITVLKSAVTVIADKNGEIFINSSGNNAMSTGGMGDVLTGYIGGFLSQGMNCLDASVFSVYLHGFAGDILRKEKNISLLPTDIVNITGKTLNLIESKAL